MKTYYNEFDANAAAWLHNLIAAGEISQGEVDERSIKEVRGSELAGIRRAHFFAGIGGWDLALKLAGWPEDREVWTGSCPCQPYSSAGKQKGDADERNLWPDFFRLIAERRPQYVFGEQVSAAIKHGWLDKVFSDLESIGYVCGASVLTASAVGANHIRSRIFWGAYLSEMRGEKERLQVPVGEEGQERPASVMQGLRGEEAEKSGAGKNLRREQVEASSCDSHDPSRAQSGEEVRHPVRPGQAPSGVGGATKSNGLRNDGATSDSKSVDEQIALFLDSEPRPNKTGEGVHDQKHSNRGVGDELRSTELGREGTGPSDESVAFQERLNVLISARIQSQIEADQNAGRTEPDGGDSVGANHIRQRLYWGAAICSGADAKEERRSSGEDGTGSDGATDGADGRIAGIIHGRDAMRLAQDPSGLRRRGRDVRRDEGDTGELEPQGEVAGLGVGGGIPERKHCLGRLCSPYDAANSCRCRCRQCSPRKLANSTRLRKRSRSNEPGEDSRSGQFLPGSEPRRDSIDDVAVRGMGDGDEDGRERGAEQNERAVGPGQQASRRGDVERSNPWSDFRLVLCTDGRARRVGREIFPLSYGLPRSMGQLGPELERAASLAGLSKESLRKAKQHRIIGLKGSGNAIVPALAAEFIRAFREALNVVKG